MFKKFLFTSFFCLTFSNFNVFAQNLIPTDLASYDSSLKYSNAFSSLNSIESIESISIKKSNGAKIRNIGIGLTSFGILCIVGGASMVKAADGVVSYNYQYNSNGETHEEGSAKGAFGALGIVGGSVAVIGGVTMWIIGQRKINNSKQNVSFSILPNGAYFAYRF
jgi:hypothetical protein